MRHGSFTDKVRKLVKTLGQTREVKVSEVAIKLDLVGGQEKRLLYRALCDLQKAGEIERTRTGFYRWKGKAPAKPEFQEVMWRILRARKVVTIEDLQELAGAKESYIKEWLCMLVRRDVVRKVKGGRYQLINDTVEMPRNEKKAARLRRMRANKTDALKALDKAHLAITEARKAIVSISE